MALRYTYEKAYKPDGTEKEFQNRITWEDNDSENPSDWTFITKLYNPTSEFIRALRELSPEEIQEVKNILGIQ